MHDFWKRLIRALKVLTGYNKLPVEDRHKKFKSIFEELVLLYPVLQGKLIIENGLFNYDFNEGELLKVDFCLPELGIFVLLGDINTCSPKTADIYGISKEELLEARKREALILNFFSRMKKTEEITLVYFGWDEPLNQSTVIPKLNGVLNV